MRKPSHRCGRKSRLDEVKGNAGLRDAGLKDAGLRDAGLKDERNEGLRDEPHAGVKIRPDGGLRGERMHARETRLGEPERWANGGLRDQRMRA